MQKRKSTGFPGLLCEEIAHNYFLHLGFTSKKN